MEAKCRKKIGLGGKLCVDWGQVLGLGEGKRRDCENRQQEFWGSAKIFMGKEMGRL